MTIKDLLHDGVVLGDGGYLIELERRGYVDSGSGREKVGTGRGSGQFTPEVAIENPDALCELHYEFLNAGSQVLQALTFFGTREKLTRAGYGADTERINAAAVKIAKDVAGDEAYVAGSVSRTQLVEREGMGALDKARDHLAEQIRLLKSAGVDLLILETFFHLAEMKVALECAAESNLPTIATMSFRPLITKCSDGHTPAECARTMAGLGAIAVGANCEQEPKRMLELLRQMRAAVSVPLAAQPAAFQTSEECHSFTRLPAFPDDLETIQVSRRAFKDFGRIARAEGIHYVGGCCGCNAAYIRALAQGLAEAK
ncbi:MAG: homocysteine S-methyltransferase family protein [Verrucomicrobia subdivision 3 bacterium]|nr:homocysteine S-methyltransferase family protein [Limisphaerales bacterium]